MIEAIEKVAARPEVKAAVLIGAGKTFIAGSNLRESSAPIERPSLPEVIAAIEAVRSSTALPIDQALAAERSAFEQLRTSREALALRHQFFAERDSAKHPALSGVQPRSVKTIAVIGAGTMRLSQVGAA